LQFYLLDISAFDTVRVKGRIAAPKDLRPKTLLAKLVRYVPSGIYFPRIRVRGKLIRRSLKASRPTVAKLRLNFATG
jgi:hypothetical protein